MAELLEGLPAGFFDGLGTVGLSGLIFWLIVRGHLVTRREHDLVIADRDYWRKTAEMQNEAIAKLNETADATLNVTRATAENLTQALQDAAKSGGR